MSKPVGLIIFICEDKIQYFMGEAFPQPYKQKKRKAEAFRFFIIYIIRTTYPSSEVFRT